MCVSTGVRGIFKEEALNKNAFRAPLRSGFTLIELLVVVLIIGILAAVALPQYQQAVLRARFSNVWQVVQNLRKGAELYYLQNGQYKDNLLSELDVDYSKVCKGSAARLRCEKNFLIDMNNGRLLLFYSPNITMDPNEDAMAAYQATPTEERVFMDIYFEHSIHPNTILCRADSGNTSLCNKLLEYVK